VKDNWKAETSTENRAVADDIIISLEETSKEESDLDDSSLRLE
jgi:hypothetical protein